ncbi:exodeoxyribonuclease V subunit alpha [Myxococcota bacterium]|nr:exodeoxyribonuclease V subunit alpha [Myxococcota bacterium]MBU1432120.1 exodeoxyribonuclease V subunit alpha [Myxococcota bacterium]MBU1900327.1 exodeoxyribonuclease V subunit alpha [Myxococcota bacterium]
MSEAPSPLELWREAGVLSPLDVSFAHTLCRLAGVDHPEILLGVAIASRAPSQGHVRAELGTLKETVRVEPKPGEELPPELPWPEDLAAWVGRLQESGLCAAGDGGPPRPLILRGDHLYLDRFWGYERRLAAQIQRRLRVALKGIDVARLREGLDRLFPPGEDDPHQRLAATMSVMRPFAVISGGPGTGKTTTIVKILALLIEQAFAKGVREPRVVLTAHTGKAAARMAEAVREARGAMAVLSEEARRALPTQAMTIHRLLGFQPRTPSRFFHDAENPLPVDAVVVDEASMIDLPLMAKLFDAIPHNARLILLGDRDQLASVEAGAVFGDLYAEEGVDDGFSQPFSATLRAALGDEVSLPEGVCGARVEGGIWDATIHLQRSYRFGPNSGIRALSEAIKAQAADEALSILHSPAWPDVILEPVQDANALEALLRARLKRRFLSLVDAASPAQALAQMSELGLLCVHRRGVLGALWLNREIERWLVQDASLSIGARWYPGRPILITRNDQAMRLYNGDVGVIKKSEAGRLEIFFAGEAEPRGVPPARLPPHETVFALTVHKSQGSEYDEVLLILPPRVSPILTRELLYTAVTRARKAVRILGSEEVLRAGIAQRVRRASGVNAELWGAASDR